jgi:AraC family transcriptional regulator of adaptative response / DNA-3-methyladenine glycosylase II
VHTDREACLRAVAAKDPRFDGWFFVAVRTTGIYCRPSCPANPLAKNLTFHPTAAAAQQAGYRACKRCRPDASPGSPEWNYRTDAVARAMRLIADGVVDREGVPGLAARLGYSVRQVQRQLQAELGAGPLAIARAQRAQTARLMIETTDLAMTDVAAAAGFASIRAFNTTVAEVFALSPTELRRRAHGRPAPGTPGVLPLRLPFRGPLFPGNVFGHLAATGVPGVEEWRDGSYRRSLRLPHGPGIVELTPPQNADRPVTGHIPARLRLTDLRDLSVAINRCRWLLDLDADPVAIDAALAVDPHLAPLVAAAPGRRVPRTTDGEEFAVRAVLGQQVSTAAARTHAARIVAALGEPVDDPGGNLTHLFPSTKALADLDPATLAMPASRRRSLVALVSALADGRLDLSPGADQLAARAELAALPGFGPWTVDVIAMRALGDPDAFPATDLGVKQAAATLGLSAAELGAAAAAWRPWRAYAVQHLWATGNHPVNVLPEGDLR